MRGDGLAPLLAGEELVCTRRSVRGTLCRTLIGPAPQRSQVSEHGGTRALGGAAPLLAQA